MLTLFPHGSLFDTPFTPVDYILRPLSTRRSYPTVARGSEWMRLQANPGHRSN